MEQHEQGEIVWEMSLRELQVNHLSEHELPLFYDSLEDAIKDVLTNYEVELTMETNDGTTRSGDYHLGAQHEQDRIIEYLISKNVLRPAMFYEGWVAMDVDGDKGIDLDIKLGGM